jgi:hypothetical protein
MRTLPDKRKLPDKRNQTRAARQEGGTRQVVSRPTRRKQLDTRDELPDKRQPNIRQPNK